MSGFSLALLSRFLRTVSGTSDMPSRSSNGRASGIVGGVMARDNHPVPPRDADREQLQAELTRLVGTGRLQFAEFDRLSDVIWSTQDAVELHRIKLQYLAPPPPVQQGPVPMAQPDAQMTPPADNPPVISTMGEVRRTGRWTVPDHSRFKLNGSTLKLDLRKAEATAPVCTFHLEANVSVVEIIVPPGVHVENQVKDTLSTVSVDTTRPHPRAPRVVLTGVLRASHLKVITRPVPGGDGWWGRLFGNH